MSTDEYVRCPVCIGLQVAPHDPDDEHPAYQVAAAIKRHATIDAAGKAFAAKRDELHRRLKGAEFRDAIRPFERDYDQAHASAWDCYRDEVADGERDAAHAAGELCGDDLCIGCDQGRKAIARMKRRTALDGAADHAIEMAKERF